MKLTRVMAAIVLVVAVTGCNWDSMLDDPVAQLPESASTTAPQDPVEAPSSTAVEEAAQGTHTGEVFSPAVDPEVVFTGPLTTFAGSFVIRYESNSWYRESGIATLPRVGDLQWFLDTEDGCLAVDRSAFIDGTGQGHEIMITPVPDGEISIGESIPLWIEGDWLIHDGCSRDDPIIHQGQ